MNARVEYEVQGWYADAHGWETVTTEETLPEAQAQKDLYDRETVTTEETLPEAQAQKDLYDREEPQYRHRVRRVEREGRCMSAVTAPGP